MAKSEDNVTVTKNRESDTVDSNNNGSSERHSPRDNNGTTSAVKYQLRPRSIQPRRVSENEWHLQDRVKQKPRQQQPLSRYRRKTANARERYRMRQINTAFENLRGVLPSWVCSRRSASDLTKITTLKLASAYIQSLQDVLDGNIHHHDANGYSWKVSSHLEDSWKVSSPLEASWKVSSHLEDSCNLEKVPSHPKPISSNMYQLTQNHTNANADLVTFLCGTSESGLVQANLESFSYLSPMSEDDPVTLLLLECDPVHSWEEGQTVPMSV